jgi:hypothetical protein
MLEVWDGRLEVCFVGLEREVAPYCFFRHWHAAIIRWLSLNSLLSLIARSVTFLF